MESPDLSVVHFSLYYGNIAGKSTAKRKQHHQQQHNKQ